MVRSGSGRTATHAFNNPGTYIVTLTIADQYNRTASMSQTIDVGSGAAPTAVVRDLANLAARR